MYRVGRCIKRLLKVQGRFSVNYPKITEWYLTILVYVFLMTWNNPLRTKYATMVDAYIFSGGSGTEAGGCDVSTTSRVAYALAAPDLPRSEQKSR